MVHALVNALLHSQHSIAMLTAGVGAAAALADSGASCRAMLLRNPAFQRVVVQAARRLVYLSILRHALSNGYVFVEAAVGDVFAAGVKACTSICA